MAGNIGHKVVVDINLTSVDVSDEEDSGEEMAEEDDSLADDEELLLNSLYDLPEEMEVSSRNMSEGKLADRPVRKRKPKQQFHCPSFGWSYEEKRKLLKALQKHPLSAIDLIQADVSSKTELQIKDFMNKINKSIHQWKSDPAGNNPMPVKDWINMTRDLVRTEKKDYTDSLSRTMSIISSFGNHPAPAERTPDYSAIYKYLGLVLQGKELPLLGPLESAVMLDLIYGVVDKIAMSDTKRQRQLMRWKYKLLTSKVDTQNNHLFIRQARKALSNDFEEFQNSSNATAEQKAGSSRTETGQTSSPSQQRSTVPANTITATVSASVPSQSTSTSRKSQVINETLIISHNHDESTNPEPATKPQQGPPKKRHKNSDVEFSIKHETDIIVSKNPLVSDSETGEGVGNHSKNVKEKEGTKGVVQTRHLTGDVDGDSIQVVREEDKGPPVKRWRRDADVILQPQPDSHVVHRDSEKTKSTTNILDSEQLNKKACQEQTSSGSGGQAVSEATGENSKSSPGASRPSAVPPVKKKKAIGRPRKGVFKKQEDSVNTNSYVRPGRPAGLTKVIPVRPVKVIEDPSEIPKKPSLYTLNPLCIPVSLLPLHSKIVCKSETPVVDKKSFPAIVTKKRGPLFNKQKTEGITSVSIHRMAATIPVSKQHILLPNSATQKSQS